MIPSSPRSGSFTRASSICYVFPTLEPSLSPKLCCAFPTRCGYGHIPFRWKALPHCVIKISSLFRRSGSLNWNLFFSFLTSTSICSSMVAPNTTSSTCVTSFLSKMSPMKLTLTLHGIALILEIKGINHCWTSPVLFLLHMGGKAAELQLVFLQKDWYPWHLRIHELSPQADLLDIFSHPMSNWVETARAPVSHNSWADVRAAPHCPGFRGFRSRSLARWLTEEMNCEDVCVVTFWSLERWTVLKGSILRRLWWICYSLCHGDQISDRNNILEWGIILALDSWDIVHYRKEDMPTRLLGVWWLDYVTHFFKAWWIREQGA